MLLAAGEEISISLLTMALQELGVSAISLTGWQAGFNTDRAYSRRASSAWTPSVSRVSWRATVWSSWQASRA